MYDYILQTNKKENIGKWKMIISKMEIFNIIVT